MRLLQRNDDGRITLTKDLIDDIPPYAILSHTWGKDDEEVVFKDIDENNGRQSDDYQQKIGYRKIELCAHWAAADSLQYFWVDSCCIDKSSSSELQTAITSMFRWYQDAAKCYVYLSDVDSNKEQHQITRTQLAWESAFRKSKWFTRGWTLQELLAPRCLEFFSRDGHRLASRPELYQLLQQITGIAIEALHGKPLTEFSPSMRMSWSRNRNTKRREDKAYSLIGILDVSMWVNYGEGEERAMARLRAAIDKRWGPQHAEELLAAIPTTKAEATPNKTEVQERRRLLMDSLSFDKIDARHSNIKPAYGKTCAWLSGHPSYVGWLNLADFPQHHGFLWIHGKPGAGKSTLMKYILTRAQENGSTTISFFFNARGNDLERSTEGMYRSLLLQLLRTLPDLQEVLDQTDPAGQRFDIDGSWEIHVLQNLLSAAIARLGQRRAICFVDALDECGESQVRDMVEYFEQLGEAAPETKGSFYICFSSRHYPAITIQNGWTLTLENQTGHSQDLDKYVRSKLRAGKGKDLSLVRNQLLEKAAGVFMWVVLVVDLLNKEFQRGRIFAVHKRLRELPAELSALFRDILRRDTENLADLLLCIQWVLYAKRPLRLEEFYYAMVAGLDLERESLVEWNLEDTTTDDMKRFVSSSSKGLAEVTKSKAPTVQFIHESVRDFLLKDGGIDDLWPSLDTDFQSQSHAQLRDCCYAYMKSDLSGYISFDQELPMASSDQAKVLRQQVSERFPFLEYATHQVLYHADTAATNLSQKDFLRGFDLETWIYRNNLLQKFEIRRHTSSASLPYILAENNFAKLIKTVLQYDLRVDVHGERYEYPLFAALVNGHLDAVRALLQLENQSHDGTSVMTKVEYGRSFKVIKGQMPLSWAAGNGHKEIVQLLLDKGADFQSKDSFGRTPLRRAADNGHEEIVQLLLDKGADFQSKDSSGWTPLSWAAENGHEEIVQLLLDKGADFQSKDISGRTPLSWAAGNGHKEIFQLLLDKGADFQSKDISSRTPLWRAAQNGDKETFQLLLDKGADFESKEGYGRTLLSCAAGNGHKEIVQLLLDKGADFQSKDSSSRTPLSWAAENGHEEIFQLLLDKGADFQSKDSSSRTPLSWAAENGHEEIFQLLLDKGADFQSKDSSSRTPLSWAAGNGHKEIVQLLLDKGADFQSKDSSSRTPLSWAAENGHEEIVQLLLDKGANFQSKDSYSRTPLWRAAGNGHEEIVQLLLDKGADFQSKDSFGRTSLSCAAGNGHKEIFQLLLDKGADFQSKDIFGWTPLSWAAQNGHEEIFQLLLDKGADFQSKDSSSRTPLSWAAGNGHKEIFQLLLDKGANFQSKDISGRTPLSWAAGNGHKEIFQLLLDKGVNFQFKDSFGWTPLSWAAGNGHEEIVQLLLDKGADFESKESYGRTPLSCAAGNGHKETVQLLLDKGADFQSKDSFGRTPLRRAADNGHEEIVQLLLDKGADFQSKDSSSRTPLSWAVDHGHKEIVQLLLDKGADFEHKDRSGQTPLWRAVDHGHKEIVQLLLDKGADFQSKDSFGRTPLSCAAGNGHKEIVQLLLDKGAAFEHKDRSGQTPLWRAVDHGHKEIVQLLLDKGAAFEHKDRSG